MKYYLLDAKYLMLTYHQFIEDQNKEQKEEQNVEKNESPKHKAKISEAKQEQLDFFQKRKAGAAEIAQKAKKKGGASILTYWHFSAKATPYNEVIRAIKNDEPESYFLSKCKEIFATIQCGKMKQRNFQKAMGKMEVWGEALAELFK